MGIDFPSGMLTWLLVCKMIFRLKQPFPVKYMMLFCCCFFGGEGGNDERGNSVG